MNIMDKIVLLHILGVIVLFGSGYLFGLMKKKPCQKCQLNDEETEKLVKEQQELSKGFN